MLGIELWKSICQNTVMTQSQIYEALEYLNLTDKECSKWLRISERTIKRYKQNGAKGPFAVALNAAIRCKLLGVDYK